MVERKLHSSLPNILFCEVNSERDSISFVDVSYVWVPIAFALIESGTDFMLLYIDNKKLQSTNFDITYIFCNSDDIIH